MATGKLNYTPSKTIREFMLNDHPMRAVMGPVGSGKTTGAIVELLRRSIQMPKGADGLRHSVMLIARNTKQQLKDTTLASVTELLPVEIWKWRESDMTLVLNFSDIRSKWLFRSLDTPEDVQRVLSLQVSSIWVEEAREIPVQLLSDLEGRRGRFPSQAPSDEFPKGFHYWSGIIYTTNPPEIDSPHYKLLEHLPQEDGDDNSIIDAATFKQPSGLSPEAENLENLRPGYYEELSKGKKKDWINVYVHGRYAKSMSGKPVYEDSFQYDRRVKRNLPIDPTLPVIIGLDAARNPAAVFMQIGRDGKLRKLREAIGKDMGMKTFIASKLTPLIRNHFPLNPLVFVGDPSWTRKNDTDDNSTMKELKKHFVTGMPGMGHAVKSAATNDPIARINALDDPFRNWWPDGEPGVEYDAECQTLVTALRSKYRYTRKKTTDGEMRDMPDKTHPWSDIADADQYGTLFILSKHYRATDYAREFMKSEPLRPSRPADSYAGY